MFCQILVVYRFLRGNCYGNKFSKYSNVFVNLLLINVCNQIFIWFFIFKFPYYLLFCFINLSILIDNFCQLKNRHIQSSVILFNIVCIKVTVLKYPIIPFGNFIFKLILQSCIYSKTFFNLVSKERRTNQNSTSLLKKRKTILKTNNRIQNVT